jgi:hypothetical protein
MVQSAFSRASAALLLLSLTALSAHAADRRVTVVNKTKVTVVEFYASAVGTDHWEEDILGQDTLEPGDLVEIDIDDGSGACRFDFKAVFDDNDEVIKKKVDVCSVSTFTLTQ